MSELDTIVVENTSTPEVLEVSNVDIPIITETVENTGTSEVLEVSNTDVPISMDSLEVPIAAPPPVEEFQPLSINDIMNDIDVLLGTEANDRAMLENIGNMSYNDLRNQLKKWAIAGFPNIYSILDIPIQGPKMCSDGITRNLEAYIEYVTGKTLYQHVSMLQTKVVDINITFAFTGSDIQILVSKQ
jgi:hypothetical protein